MTLGRTSTMAVNTYARAPPAVRLNARAVCVMKRDKSTASHAPAPVTHDLTSAVCHFICSQLNQVILSVSVHALVFLQCWRKVLLSSLSLQLVHIPQNIKNTIDSWQDILATTHRFHIYTSAANLHTIVQSFEAPLMLEL